MKFRLYMIKSVVRLLKESWPQSAFISKNINEKGRLAIYFDLVYSAIRIGADYIDYTTFSFWNKSHKEQNTYITRRRNDTLRFRLTSPEAYETFLDKALFNQKFSGFIKRKWMKASSFDDKLLEFVNTNSPVIAKPLTDYGGHGIVCLDKELNEYKQRLREIKERIDNGTEYIIEEKIENRKDIKALAPASLNTIRIVTVLGSQGRVNVIASLLRMGDGVNIMDNFHSGGMACVIDPANGKLKGNAYGMDFREYVSHPFSGIKFDGYTIEGFDEMLSLAKELALFEPKAHYVGWDIAVTPNGLDLLEGNIPPGEDITQIATGKGYWFEINKMI